MRFRTYKNTDLTVSEVGFGLWTISTGWWGDFTEGEAIALMHKAFDVGITLFDAAEEATVSRLYGAFTSDLQTKMACKPGSASAKGPAAITCSPKEIARGSSTRWSRERLAIQLNFSKVPVQTCGPLLLNRILATASFSLTRLHDASTSQNKGRVHWSGVANLARPKCAISQKSRILVGFHRFSYRTR